MRTPSKRVLGFSIDKYVLVTLVWLLNKLVVLGETHKNKDFGTKFD